MCGVFTARKLRFSPVFALPSLRSRAFWQPERLHPSVDYAAFLLAESFFFGAKYLVRPWNHSTRPGLP